MSDENNVDNKMVKLKLILAHGKCLNCGYERTLYLVKELYPLKVECFVLMQIFLVIILCRN